MSNISSFFNGIYQQIIKLKKTNSPIFWGLVAIFVLFFVGISAIILTKSMFPSQQTSFIASMPTMMPTDFVYANTATPLPTQLAVPTATPKPSNLWIVNKISGKQTIGGYTALVVEFKNDTTGELRSAQCQSPHDPAPSIGDIFVSEEKSGYTLLAPVISGTENPDLNSKVQRFIFIQ